MEASPQVVHHHGGGGHHQSQLSSTTCHHTLVAPGGIGDVFMETVDAFGLPLSPGGSSIDDMHGCWPSQAEDQNAATAASGLLGARGGTPLSVDTGALVCQLDFTLSPPRGLFGSSSSSTPGRGDEEEEELGVSPRGKNKRVMAHSNLDGASPKKALQSHRAMNRSNDLDAAAAFGQQQQQGAAGGAFLLRTAVSEAVSAALAQHKGSPKSQAEHPELRLEMDVAGSRASSAASDEPSRRKAATKRRSTVPSKETREMITAVMSDPQMLAAVVSRAAAAAGVVRKRSVSPKRDNDGKDGDNAPVVERRGAICAKVAGSDDEEEATVAVPSSHRKQTASQRRNYAPFACESHHSSGECRANDIVDREGEGDDEDAADNSFLSQSILCDLQSQLTSYFTPTPSPSAPAAKKGAVPTMKARRAARPTQDGAKRNKRGGQVRSSSRTRRPTEKRRAAEKG